MFYLFLGQKKKCQDELEEQWKETIKLIWTNRTTDLYIVNKMCVKKLLDRPSLKKWASK